METKIKYLTQLEADDLFLAIKNDISKHTIRNYALFAVAKYCALRVTEAASLCLDDYNTVNHHIYCKRNKSSHSNTLRIVDPLVLQALNAYMQIRPQYGDSKYLFVSQRDNSLSRKTLDYWMKYYCRIANISEEKRHFHALKHTRAVELADKGMDVKEIQWWLGHKNVNNTLIYMQFTTSQQNLLYQKLQLDGRT